MSTQPGGAIEFVATVHVRGDSKPSAHSIILHASSIEDAEHLFYARCLDGDTFRITVGETLFIIDRSAVDQISIAPIKPTMPNPGIRVLRW